MYGGFYGGFRPYVPVGVRLARARKAMAKRKKKGQEVAPVRAQGRQVASTFWGRAWCSNIERYSDFASRLPRGRTYLRNGSVVHLGIDRGRLEAFVAGSELYSVKVRVAPVKAAPWKALCSDCVGSIDSLVELLKGELDEGVMERVCRDGTGLFPRPEEIEFDCSCPDGADLCKHVAAVLYGVGVRLDTDPELLFRLRKVSAADLVARAARPAGLTRPDAVRERTLREDELESVFGLDLGSGGARPAAPVSGAGRVARPRTPAAYKAGPPPTTLSLQPARPSRRRAAQGADAPAPHEKPHATQHDTPRGKRRPKRPPGAVES